jgi:hypothetical protein
MIGSTAQFNLNSSVMALLPSLNLEINILNGVKTRGFIEGGISYGYVNVFNLYSFTVAGQGNYGLDEFEEHIKATLLSYSFGGGFEFLIADKAVVSLRGQYKILNPKEFVHRRSLTTFQGAVIPGTVATYDNGNNRSLNLTGIYTALGLRIYY